MFSISWQGRAATLLGCVLSVVCAAWEASNFALDDVAESLTMEEVDSKSLLQIEVNVNRANLAFEEKAEPISMPLSQECLQHLPPPHDLDILTYKESCKYLPAPEIISEVCQPGLATNFQEIFDEDIKHAQSYVMFLANGHSGHSLIGSLLDSHPSAIIANEADAFTNWTKGSQRFSTRKSFLQSLLNNSLSCGLYSRWQHEYNYTVPHGWNGRWQRHELTVIGDKKGGETTKVLSQLFLENTLRSTWDRFEDFIGLPIKIVHVFWSDKDRDFNERELLIHMLTNRTSMRTSVLPFNNTAYACDDPPGVRREQILRLCEFVGLECGLDIVSSWSSMAVCGLSKDAAFL